MGIYKMASRLVGLSTVRQFKKHDLLQVLALIVVSLAMLFVRLVYSPAPVSADVPVGDFAAVWARMAETILSEGVPYVDQWDNKTPLWSYFHVALAAVGPQYLLFIFLLAVANAVSAFFIIRLGGSLGQGPERYLGVVLFFVLLVYNHGYIADPRPFANTFILAALLIRKPERSGLLTAVACLCSQYYALLIPVVVTWHHLRSSINRGWILRYAAAGFTVVAVTYGSVLVIWGQNAFIASIDQTMLGIMPFIEHRAEKGQFIAADPLSWAFWLAVHHLRTPTLPVAGAAIVGIYRYAIHDRIQDVGFLTAALSLSAIPILISPASTDYQVAVAPWLCLLAAYGLRPLTVAGS
jgi:hypothetical protein